MRDVLVDRRRTALALAGVAAAALAAWLVAEPEPAPPATPGTAVSVLPSPLTPSADAPAPTIAPVAQAASTAASAPLAPAARDTAGAPRGQGVFGTDAQGRLVLDQVTRLRMEALLALHEGEALAARIEAELARLPPPAAARARELLEQFEAYQAAQRATLPPAQAPLVPEEGLAQLAVLQALRASHFGAEAAQRMFAEDDAVARRLLELMRQDGSTQLSMEDKAMRAQARFDIERGAIRP